MPNSIFDDKRKILHGIFLAWAMSSVFIMIGYWLSETFNLFSQYSLMQITALALIPPTFSLVIGIGWAARSRFFGQNIDGSPPKSRAPLDIILRYIQNTTEQITVFALAIICLAGAATQHAKVILPILGLWFFIARMVFWAGYAKSPRLRAAGFASTFHPSVLVLIFASISVITNH